MRINDDLIHFHVIFRFSKMSRNVGMSRNVEGGLTHSIDGALGDAERVSSFLNPYFSKFCTFLKNLSKSFKNLRIFLKNLKISLKNPKNHQIGAQNFVHF